MAGGTDLLVQLKAGSVSCNYVVDIGELHELNYLTMVAQYGLTIGATTTIRTLETDAVILDHYPVVAESAGTLGSVAIRNVATVGGNLCNAAPSADMAPALVALSATVRLIGPESERMLPLEQFFVGPGDTALRHGELLASIHVPPLPRDAAGVYLKHSLRNASDLPVAAVGGILQMDGQQCKDVRLVLGAVAPTPMRARAAEDMLLGQVLKNDLIEQAARTASEESRPITDVRASAAYRKEMVRVLTKRAMTTLLARVSTL
jgi:carbon-monoxide dehydrogenase medium subunit